MRIAEVSNRNESKKIRDMRKFIHIDNENRDFLMRTFGVTQRTVYNATHYVDGSPENDLHARIRRLALQRGGVLMNELPAIQTLHDADGYMRQYLPGGVMIEFSKADGRCNVTRNGSLVLQYDNVKVSEIASVQQTVANLAEMWR